VKSTPAIFGRRQAIVTVIAVMIAVVAGPFGTSVLPLLPRLLFWSVLIGVNTLKWALWYRHGAARAGAGWQATALLVVAGAILLNLTLPFEIMLTFALVGMTVVIPWAANFAAAMVVSLGVGAGIAMARNAGEATTAEAPLLSPPSSPPPSPLPTPLPPPPPSTMPPAPETGLALRAGLRDLAGVECIMAEDHYLRLHLADGRTPLVLYRFGDALLELAAIDGEQVHRGAWVAASAVRGAVREGRRWRLRLAGGMLAPVSETFLPAVRARGWLVRERA